MKIAKKYLPPITLILISTIGAAYAVTTLFTQTFPAIPSTSAAITANCATLTPNAASVISGSSGNVIFDCSGSSAFGTTPAFVVNGGTAMIPSFTLPSGYVSLASINPALPSSCLPGGGAVLTSGTPLTLSAGPGNYCATYSNAPSTGLETFTVTWSQ